MKGKNIYNVVVPTWFKIVSALVYILFTAVMLIFDLTVPEEVGLPAGTDLLLLGMGSIFLELVADYSILGDICGKGESRMQYLRASYYGRSAIRKLAYCDCLRRTVFLLGASALIAVGTLVSGYELPEYYFYYCGANTGLVLFVENITILIGRCIGTFQIRMLITSLVAVMVMPINVTVFTMFIATDPGEAFTKAIYIILTAVALLFGTVSVLISCRVTLKRMMAGYRDYGTIG